jgi:hypothetical protein
MLQQPRYLDLASSCRIWPAHAANKQMLYSAMAWAACRSTPRYWFVIMLSCVDRLIVGPVLCAVVVLNGELAWSELHICFVTCATLRPLPLFEAIQRWAEASAADDNDPPHCIGVGILKLQHSCEHTGPEDKQICARGKVRMYIYM